MTYVSICNQDMMLFSVHAGDLGGCHGYAVWLVVNVVEGVREGGSEGGRE